MYGECGAGIVPGFNITCCPGAGCAPTHAGNKPVCVPGAPAPVPPPPPTPPSPPPAAKNGTQFYYRLSLLSNEDVVRRSTSAEECFI